MSQRFVSSAKHPEHLVALFTMNSKSIRIWVFTPFRSLDQPGVISLTFYRLVFVSEVADRPLPRTLKCLTRSIANSQAVPQRGTLAPLSNWGCALGQGSELGGGWALSWTQFGSCTASWVVSHQCLVCSGQDRVSARQTPHAEHLSTVEVDYWRMK